MSANKVINASLLEYLFSSLFNKSLTYITRVDVNEKTTTETMPIYLINVLSKSI